MNSVIDPFRILTKLRGFWFWLMVISIVAVILYEYNTPQHYIIWKILLPQISGVILGIWLTKIGDLNYIFVYCGADLGFMIENTLFLFPLKIYKLGDRIFLSILGSSFDKVIVVNRNFANNISCFGLCLGIFETLKIEEKMIITSSAHNTQYLKINHLDQLYAFPDVDTLECFKKWVKFKYNYELKSTELDEREITKYPIGKIIPTSILWLDQDVKRYTK